MYNPKTNYNSNSSFNKYKGTYFNNDVDISGGHLILRTNGSNLYLSSNSNLYSLNNRIQFNDISNNIYFYSPLKMNYNNIEYDIGQQLGKIQDLNNKIGPMNFLNNSNIFYNNIDISSGNINIRNGNLYLAPNSSIFTENNQIQFNEEFQFCDFINNVNVLGQLKNTYNSVEYDVGLQCEKTDQIISTVSTLSPIVYDTAFKCTNFYYDQASNSTVWSGLLTCPISSIASTSIANTSRFIEGTGNQNIGGIKTFTTAPVMSGASITGIPASAITNTAVVLSGAQSITGTKTYTVAQNFSNNIRLDGSLLLSSGTITLTNANLQKIALISTISSDIQIQLNMTNSNVTTLTNNSISLSALNTFSGATNTFTNNIRLDSSLLLNGGAITITNATLQKLQYISTITSDIQTQTTTNATNINESKDKITTLSTKNTDISYTVGTTTTTISNNLVFTGTLNNIIPTVFSYLSNLNGNIQDQLNTLAIKLTAISYASSITTIANTLASSTLTFSTSINNINTTTFGYLSGATENLQSAINALKTKTDTTNINLATTTTSANEAKQRTTDIEFSAIPTPQTNISNKVVLQEVVFETDLNDITPTTFSYLQGCTSSIQNQLNSKIDSVQGTIIQHVSANLQTIFPSRFLLCNGQNVSRTTYNVLFSIIGTTYGSGDGSTTFGIPDYRACFLRMYSDARTVNGVVYAPNTPNTIQQDSLEAHVHSSNLSGNYLRSGTTFNTNNGYLVGANKPNQTDFPSFTSGVSSSHRTSTETRPLNHSVYFYITC